MTRLVPLVLSALLSTFASGVDAKSKNDQIRLYEFIGDRCDEHPKGGNIDIKRGECLNIDARSLKPRIDEKRSKWLNEVNDGKVECALYVYEKPACEGGEHEDVLSLPEEIDKCYTSPTQYALNSIKFICDKALKIDKSTKTFTAVVKTTSWSIGEDKNLTPHATTETVTSTVTDAELFAARLPTHVARRDHLEPRDKKNDIGVWMLHPWTGSIICYRCYTKKENEYDWVKCFSGHEVPHLCGARPVDQEGKAITMTSTATTSSTMYITESIAVPGTKTVTHTTTTAATKPLPIQARSWHKKVAFHLPWTNHPRVCADAEWEKRGKPDSEIRLQDVHLANDHECKEAQSLDLPDYVRDTETQTVVVVGTETLTGVTAMVTVTETHYTYATTMVVTQTGAFQPEVSDGTTYFPTVKTITELHPTATTVSAFITKERTTTVWPGGRKNEHEDEHDGESIGDRDAPPHRDL